MNPSELWTIYLAGIAVLWLFLGFTSILFFRTSRLRRKGHEDRYIAFLQKENRTRCLGIAIVVPLIALLSAGAIAAAFGGITTRNHFLYVCLLTLIGIVPFPILDSIKSRKKQKAMVIDLKKTVVIDWNYKTWHLVFQPWWEIVSALLIVSYFAWMGEYFNLAMLHIGILWLLYLAGRGGKYLTGPSLSDLYQYNLVFMTINHVLVLFHLARFVNRCCPVLGRLDHIVGILLFSFWSLKLLYYLLKVPQFRKELARLTETRDAS